MNPKNRLARCDHEGRQWAGGRWSVAPVSRPSDRTCVEALTSTGRRS